MKDINFSTREAGTHDSVSTNLKDRRPVRQRTAKASSLLLTVSELVIGRDGG